MNVQSILGILKSGSATVDHDIFKAWVRENAVPIGPADIANTDIEKLCVLDKLLKNRRIVYLGEPDHWIHEKYDFRLLLIRYLFSRGWRYVGEEMGRSDGVRVDRYIETGDPDYLERVTIYGYRGARRPDRNDDPTGILKEGIDTYPELEFRAEQIRFAKALRDVSENRPPATERLHFFGFDVDYIPGGGYEELHEWLSLAPDDAIVAEVQALLAPVTGETIAQEIARLDRCVNLIESRSAYLVELFGPERYDQIVQSLLSLRDSFDYISEANPAARWKDLSAAFATRELVMCRQMEHVLSGLAPDDKVVMMSHNLHLTKDTAGIRPRGSKSGPGGGRVPTIGEFVNRLLPDQVLSVWMLYDHGQDCQPIPRLSRELRSIKGSLNSILAEGGKAYLLTTATADPRANLLSKEMQVVVSMYNSVHRMAISQQADAIFFVNKVTPLRL
jgi:erythromycin esterase-like protein